MLAIVPARGGTDRVPYLNIKRLGDRPLLAHTLDAARGSRVRRPRGRLHRRRARGRGGARATAPRCRSCGPPDAGRRHPQPEARDRPRRARAGGGGRARSTSSSCCRPRRPSARPRAIDEAIDRLVDGGFDTVVSVTEDRTLNWRERGRPCSCRSSSKEGRRDEQAPRLQGERRRGGAAARRARRRRRASASASATWSSTSARASRSTTSRTSGWRSACCASRASCSAWTAAPPIGMGHVYRSLAIADALREPRAPTSRS